MASDLSSYEIQLSAMRAVMEALKPLDDDAREAVLSWVDTQFERRLPTKSQADNTSTLERHAVKREGTVSVVAQKIGAKSARGLLTAAAAYLTLYQERDSFSKDELVACAKEARNWKSTYSNQMAINIKRMQDAGELFEKAKNVFSLSDGALSSVEELLNK